MEQNLLSDGDRAALQALVPLAGALGVGTIFALFFGGRRKSGTAMFELDRRGADRGRFGRFLQRLAAASKRSDHQSRFDADGDSVARGGLPAGPRQRVRQVAGEGAEALCAGTARVFRRCYRSPVSQHYLGRLNRKMPASPL